MGLQFTLFSDLLITVVEIANCPLKSFLPFCHGNNIVVGHIAA